MSTFAATLLALHTAAHAASVGAASPADAPAGAAAQAAAAPAATSATVSAAMPLLGLLDGEHTRWAGHQVVYGSRKVPFMGTIETRLETYLIADVERHGDELHMTQQACGLNFIPVAGVRLWLNYKALPKTPMTLAPDGKGRFTASTVTEWKREDVDDDGEPGMTVRVDAPICSGRLFVSNRSRSSVFARPKGQGVRGFITVDVEQDVLGTEGFCLRWVDPHSEERVNGPFELQPVAADATCDSLFQQGWPLVIKPGE